MSDARIVSSRLVDEAQPDGDVIVEASDGSAFQLSRADHQRVREAAAREAACLVRRQQVQMFQSAEHAAWLTYHNSHRFRQFGMGDGKVWRLIPRETP